MSVEDLVRVREKIPYSGKGIDPLLSMLRKVLNANPYTQEFLCRIGQPIEITKLVPQDEAPERLDLHAAVRAKRMEEFTVEKDKTPYQVLWAMYGVVSEEGLAVSHIMVGDKFSFQTWLGIRIPQNRMNFFGVPIVQVSELPGDVFVLVGSEKREAEPEDVMFSVKGTIP